MKIKVTDKWYLLSDPMNVIVAERKINPKAKKGEDPEYFVHKSFHHNVPQALQSLCERELRGSKATTWEGLQKAVDKQNELLEGISKKLKISVK